MELVADPMRAASLGFKTNPDTGNKAPIQAFGAKNRLIMHVKRHKS